MIDAEATIEDILEDNWGLSSPAFADLKTSYDEFNSNNPSLQLLIEDTGSKQDFITRTINKVSHSVRLTIYVRPVNYMPATIIAFKATFLSIKTEIDRILRERFFDNYTVDFTGWKDVSMLVGRDTGPRQIEPIIFISSQTFVLNYYEGDFS